MKETKKPEVTKKVTKKKVTKKTVTATSSKSKNKTSDRTKKMILESSKKKTNYEYNWNIEFKNVGLIYPNGKQALDDINLSIKEGEFVSIIGLSGAGKTTLLKTVNKLSQITSGEIYVGDRSDEAINKHKTIKRKYKEVQAEYDELKEEIKNETNAQIKAEKNSKLNEISIKLEKRKNRYKEAKCHKPYYMIKKLKGKNAREYKTHIGMVFQRYNLIYKSTVLSNVMTGRLAQMSSWRAFFGFFSKIEKNAALRALAKVNILETAYVRAEELSGGQMQRVALARTINQNARIILADEPVGALDPIMAKSVMDSFLIINKKENKTVLVNLHHVDLALQYSDRILGVKAGKIVFDGPAEKVTLKVLKDIYGNELENFDDKELQEIWRKRKMARSIVND